MHTAITTTTRGATAIAAYTELDAALLAGQVSEGTQAMYKRDLQAYETWAKEAGRNSLEPATLAEFRAALAKGLKWQKVGDGYAWRQTDKAYSPNTINRMLSSVRAIAKRAAEAGRIPSDIALRFGAVAGVKTSALRDSLKQDSRTRITKEDMRRLCEAPDTSTLAGKMHKALLLTMATSGLRISEVVTLTPGQIEKRKGGYILHVIGKGASESREAPLGQEAYRAIQTWLAARPVASGWIFTGFERRNSQGPRTNHIHAVSAWELVKRYAKAVGLASVKPHDFRRFVGTTIAKTDPRQAQKILGHKDINTTFKHYVLDELEPGLTDGLF